MGPGRSSVLYIGSNPSEVSSSGRTGGGIESLAMVVHRAAPGEPPFPWIRERARLTRFDILAALNI